MAKYPEIRVILHIPPTVTLDVISQRVSAAVSDSVNAQIARNVRERKEK